MHQFLMCILSKRNSWRSPWCICSACFEGTALLKIRLSIRVRNFAAPNEPPNIFKLIFYVALPYRLYGVQIMKIWAMEKSHTWAPLTPPPPPRPHLLAAEVPVGEWVPDDGEPLLLKLLLHHSLDGQPIELEAPKIIFRYISFKGRW